MLHGQKSKSEAQLLCSAHTIRSVIVHLCVYLYVSKFDGAWVGEYPAETCQDGSPIQNWVPNSMAVGGLANPCYHESVAAKQLDTKATKTCCTLFVNKTHRSQNLERAFPGL